MNGKTICCHKCKHVWVFEPPMGRRDECPSCRMDSRVCLNCRFHDRSAYRECREEQSEWVKEKNSGNFCGFFEANARISSGPSDADNAKSKLDSLFGGGESANASRRSTDSPDPSKPPVSLQDELADFLANKK